MDNELEIIIVEDSENDSILLLRTLSSAGYKVKYHVVDGRDELVGRLNNGTYDLIITDHIMPGFSSEESISIAKELSPDVPIIVVSGAKGEELAVAAMRAGAHDYVLKDDLKRLIPVVKTALDEGNRNKENKARTKRLKMFERAVEQSRNIIFITDSSGNIEHINNRFTVVTGSTLKDVEGKPTDVFYSDLDDEYTWYDIQNKVVISKRDYTGQMWSRNKDDEVFSALVSISPIINGGGEVTNLVVVAEDFSKYQETLEDLAEKAFHDPLTKLPNRLLFEERLNLTLRSVNRKSKTTPNQEDIHKRFAGLLCIDLDKFKEVNDKLGHLQGDLLLQTVAKRLENCVRDSDTVARIGGDEFCVILAELEYHADAAVVADKILRSLSETIQLSNHERNISASIGIAIMPSDGGHTHEIKDNGDKALYKAKKSGRNKYQFFNDDIDIKTREIISSIGVR